MNVGRLAEANAHDILAVQPPEYGEPYLIGGHSYGGAVAVEIAMLLEEWGCRVGLVLVRLQAMMPAILPLPALDAKGHGLTKP
jgi:thioesterase domain-containing protein